MDSSYHPLTSQDEELYQLHAEGIEQKVHETFPEIPSDFQLKPVALRKTNMCAIRYEFKLALPDDKFAKVSFMLGGDMMIPPGERKPQAPNYNVEPTSASLDDD
ncbi:unnamed protein product [Rotaria sp. Silwood1]|nr:unnamed protein product [Rotaria sp. Silwood1]CAF1515441.1 unnamed protein product [Rotaria sp. Silwood1]CAF3643804.1 unnamed protein product [Rotaria sp. Silwood1]CAF3680370.1 unnamed protein product [Rotaria sp. Silwood1]CAF3742596.1 unnamed protein product [Rotaria sp. Silwood1]